VNVFDKGTFSVQGSNSGEVEKALGATPAVAAPTGARPTRVFVVYGHDQAARTQLEAMLRRWGLDPLILDQLPSEGQTIIEKLVSYTSGAEFAVVLSTADDEGHRAGHAGENAFRARQNVVLELGMLLQKLGRKKVAILLKEQDKMERPSDIQGLIYIPFRDNLEKEAGVLLAKEMCAQGYDIAVAKL
jgi:predicted nucleotide-binding protein